MKVYTANFGKGNDDWPLCRDGSVLVTRATQDEFRYWSNGDREGFIQHAMQHTKTVRGVAPIKPVASRWFQLLSIINETNDDIWIHREKEEIWWTKSRPDPIEVKPVSGTGGSQSIGFIISKACEPWSRVSRLGASLTWGALHPKARYFLFMEATFVALGPENSAYARALIAGDPLDSWHHLPDWVKTLADAKNKGGIVFDAKQLTIFRMAWTAIETVKNSNGQVVETRVKNKELGFKDLDGLVIHIKLLFEQQEGLCALTGIPMELDKQQNDPELSCSLDRIDSDKGYDEGNLQIVCKFINSWKSSSRDEEFRRLIGIVKEC